MYNFLKTERDVADYWKGFKTFELSNSRRVGKTFVFYDGPPFATGTPHYGHLLVGTIKDVVARYKNMQGYNVPRTWGWDCHGVPVESLVQKKLNMTRVDAVQNDLVSQFNEECRRSVLTCADQWKNTVERMGRWVDFENPYKTMDKDYMESVWWVFKQIYDQGRIYKAKKIMPYSCKLQTTLSNFEISDSYREVEDPYVIVKFKSANYDCYLLAYTTTPWTLPSNSGLCVNPKEEYSYVYDEENKETYLLATKLVARVMGNRKYRIKNSISGEMLQGMKYYALYGQAKYSVVLDEFVSPEDGTGIVHLAPAFGEDDYRVGQKYNLAMIDPLDAEGMFTWACLEYKGIFCKDANEEIIGDLRLSNNVFKYGKVKHDYPFCDRTNTPLIYRAVDAWYLRLEDVRDRLLKNNEQVNWVPESVGANRFANWLRETKDWNVSRNRLWGSCLPIWVAPDGEMVCVGSVKELEELSGIKVNNLHKDTLDKVVFQKDGKTFTRVSEVLDCWFESGCMPYAQHHYPFENKEFVETNFPADFIVEGLDQTRGWFYTLLVLGTLLFDKSPYKNVMVNGLVLAENGSKMSKSKGNYTDPNELLDKYGADALRAYFCSSSALYAEPLLFREKDLQTISRGLLAPLNNALDFYKLYSGIDNFVPDKMFSATRELDDWIYAELEALISESVSHMDQYDFSKVIPKVVVFLDKLCNWYIRLSRKLFWEEGLSKGKISAYNTLHLVLLWLVKLLAPFCPFMTEQMYCDLGRRGSVHWENYPPVYESDDKSIRLMNKMRILRELSAMGHSLRVASNMKVKQPLAKMLVSGVSELSVNDKDILSEELNVKEVVLTNNMPVAGLSAKANFKSLGRRCGKEMPKVAAAIAALSTQELKNLPMTILGFEVSNEDVIITQVLNSSMPMETSHGMTVMLDTALTEVLIEEGDVRELCSALQGTRKAMKLNLLDKVTLLWSATDTETFEFMRKWSPHIEKQVLVSKFVFSDLDLTQDKAILSCGNLFFSLQKDRG